jgi:hypothetical protein
MATRFGMADGRFLTNNMPNRIYMAELEKSLGVDNSGFRQQAQTKGASILPQSTEVTPMPWLKALTPPPPQAPFVYTPPNLDTSLASKLKPFTSFKNF